jgi:hypothetical protein
VNLADKIVGDADVLSFFADCTKQDRQELMLIKALAESPHQRGAWARRMPSAHDLSSKRFGRWLVTYWPDDPVCELRIVAVEKVFA